MYRHVKMYKCTDMLKCTHVKMYKSTHVKMYTKVKICFIYNFNPDIACDENLSTSLSHNNEQRTTKILALATSYCV